VEFLVFLALKISRAFAPTQSFSDSPEAASAPMAVNDVRIQLLRVLKDCHAIDALRLGLRVQATQSVKELWLLRSDLYGCIARHHSQTEASQRINALLPCFDGWLPSRQLTRV
jgi:hypothetical protein